MLRKILSLALVFACAGSLTVSGADRVFLDTLGPEMFTENILHKFPPLPYGGGFARDGDGWVMESTTGTDQHGVRYAIRLDQSAPSPICVRAWSRAEGVTASRSNDYAIYLDVVYQDGTPCWGVCEQFSGREDWEEQALVFMPEKPIRSISMYLMFRNRTGKVWFRDPRFYEYQLPAEVGAVMLDGATGLKNPEIPDSVPGQPFSCYLMDAAVPNADWLWMSPTGKATDPATDPVTFSATGIELEVQRDVEDTRLAARSNHVVVRNTTGRDRCVTVVLAWDATLRDVAWCEAAPARRTLVTDPGAASEIRYTAPTEAGRRAISKLPLLCVGGGDAGVGLALSHRTPAAFRLFYNVALRKLCLAFDLGFIPEKSAWEFDVVRFTGLQGGLRDGWARYMEMFPEAFRVHLPTDPDTGVARLGVWMPFHPISKVPNFEDFGFRFKEGNSETQWDDDHGILTFRYTEPTTWWMSLSDEELRSAEADPDAGSGSDAGSDPVLAAGVRKVKRLAEAGNKWAQMWENSVMFGPEQLPGYRYLDTPWCKGIVWSANSMPGIAAPSDFGVKWDAGAQGAYASDVVGPGLDGEYIDSSEGYVTLELNFRREHMRVVTTPLTYDARTRQPVVLRGLTTFEYMRAISRDVRGRGRAMMANSTPHRLFWLTPLMDVLGTETNWKHGGNWTPLGTQDLLWRRMLCGHKPYCFLQNTDFSRFSYEDSERFMKRSLAFGMFPGYFSADASTGHYFSRPELYERDRPLFRKYIPLCRLVAEAGWEPITQAVASDPEIVVERFGGRDGSAGNGVYFTVFNPSTTETRTCRLTFDQKWSGKSFATLLGDGDATREISLAPEDVFIFKVLDHVQDSTQKE